MRVNPRYFMTLDLIDNSGLPYHIKDGTVYIQSGLDVYEIWLGSDSYMDHSRGTVKKDIKKLIRRLQEESAVRGHKRPDGG